MIEAYHTAAFLRLAAIELRQIAFGVYDLGGFESKIRQIQGIAAKLDAEAKDLQAALAPTEGAE